MTVRQAELSYGSDTLVAWIPDRTDVRVGSLISLKGDDARIWTVERLYETRMESQDINRRWRVGGLA